MVVFHQAEITRDGKRLLIDASVSHYDFDKDTYITGIYLDESKNYSVLGPSEKALVLYSGLDKEGKELKSKHVKIIHDFELEGISSDDLLFVWVLTTDMPEDAPCNLRATIGLRVVYNKWKIYSESMNYIKTIDNCTPSLDMINYMLRLMAFKMSLEAGNFIQAIKYWNEFFNKKYKDCVIHRCGCNG